MLNYYLKLAWLSLKTHRGLSVLMVLAISLGVATAMTSYSVLRRMSSDPIPSKSEQLFALQLDNWDAERPFGEPPQDMPDQLSYIDLSNLLAASAAPRQVGMYKVVQTVVPENRAVKPYNAALRVTTRDFFEMFQVPFAHGAAWSAGDDARAAASIVLTKKSNDKLFGGENSVGRSLRLGSDVYTITGVLQAWDVKPLFYDVSNGPLNDTEAFFIPLSTASARNYSNSGNTNCYAPARDGFDGLKRSECIWTQFWVELPDAGAKTSYEQFLENYVAQQKKLGRAFPRKQAWRLSNVMQWLTLNRVVPDDTRTLAWIGFAFLMVCLLNAAGLLLAKFLRRSSEIGLRRALGAPKSSIFAQHLIEAGLIGMAGAVLGLSLTAVALFCVRKLLPNFEAVARLDWSLVLMCVVLSIATALASGFYPAWRACRIPPATQLKSN